MKNRSSSPAPSLTSKTVRLSPEPFYPMTYGPSYYTPNPMACADVDPQQRAFADWLSHADAGRIGGPK